MTFVSRTEVSALLKLGTPIAIAQTLQIGMQVIDTVMVGRFAAADLAGIALAASLIMPFMVMLTGVLHAVTPITAQLFGAGAVQQVGASVRQGVWLAVLVSTLLMLIVANIDVVLPWFGVTPDVAQTARGYMHAVLWGYPAAALFLLLRKTFEGLGRTRPAMVIAALMLLLNIPLNYAFIYGEFGAPRLGGIGAGVATAIVMWLQFLLILLVTQRPTYRAARLWRGSWRIDHAQIVELARVGIPIGLKTFGAVGVFALVTLLVAPFGAASVAAGSIGGNIATVIFMVPNGLGMAATIRIGHAIGAGQPELARDAGSSAVILCTIYAVCVTAALIAFRIDLAMLYSHSPQVVALTAHLLIFVAIYQLMDSIQEPAVGALRGYKDTRVPMVIALSGYWLVGLPIAAVFGYGWFTPDTKGVHGFWIGLAAGELYVAILMNLRRRRFAFAESSARA
jgi:MATE family multidrug resistance protein